MVFTGFAFGIKALVTGRFGCAARILPARNRKPRATAVGDNPVAERCLGLVVSGRGIRAANRFCLRPLDGRQTDTYHRAPNPAHVTLEYPHANAV